MKVKVDSKTHLVPVRACNDCGELLFVEPFEPYVFYCGNCDTIFGLDETLEVEVGEILKC